MSDTTGLREDLRSEVETLVVSGVPDEEVLNDVVRRVHDARPLWDWSGIYLLVGETLVLGPRTAPADHSRIAIGEGVCGTAVSEDRNQVVEDVREVENYLACSIHTRSELVVLIRDSGKIVGEFDIDSDTVGAFSARTKLCLRRWDFGLRPRRLPGRRLQCELAPRHLSCQKGVSKGRMGSSSTGRPPSVHPDL